MSVWKSVGGLAWMAAAVIKGRRKVAIRAKGYGLPVQPKTPLTEARHIYWFESAYDAMAYYQLHQANDKDLRKAVFVSTGGNPTVEQMRGVLTLTLPARQHICFDTDLAGIEFAKNLQQEMYRAVRSTIEQTPERKAYLDSVADGKNLDEGDIELLPDALRSSYGKYESAWEEAMSMRSSGLCHPDDIREQTDIMNGNTRSSVKDCGSSSVWTGKTTPLLSVNSLTYPNKDWNEQLLAELKREETVDETQAREQSPEEEQQTHFRR